MAPGYVAIGAADGSILAARIDPATGKLLSTPTLVLQGVQLEGTNGTVQFAVSRSGTIVFQEQTATSSGIVWVDRKGHQSLVDTTMAGLLGDVALSPDGTRIAVSKDQAGESQVWVKQLTTGTFTRLSFNVTNANRPVWTPDGSRVAFLASRGGRRTVWSARSDGSGGVEAASPPGVTLDEVSYDPKGQIGRAHV